MMRHPKMVSIERTAKERKYDAPKVVGEGMKKPMYGYGTKITLEEEELEKLGCEGEMPEVGDEFHIMAVGEVVAVRDDAFEGGITNRCVEIQLTHMGVVEEEAEADHRKPGEVLYGHKEDENEE